MKMTRGEFEGPEGVSGKRTDGLSFRAGQRGGRSTKLKLYVCGIVWGERVPDQAQRN